MKRALVIAVLRLPAATGSVAMTASKPGPRMTSRGTIFASRGRHDDAVSVTSRYNIGGPYDLMEHSLGWAMSVCIAEKVAEPLVRWDAPVSALQDIEYRH